MVQRVFRAEVIALRNDIPSGVIGATELVVSELVRWGFKDVDHRARGIDVRYRHQVDVLAVERISVIEERSVDGAFVPSLRRGLARLPAPKGNEVHIPDSVDEGFEVRSANDGKRATANQGSGIRAVRSVNAVSPRRSVRAVGNGESPCATRRALGLNGIGVYRASASLRLAGGIRSPIDCGDFVSYLS